MKNKKRIALVTAVLLCFSSMGFAQKTNIDILRAGLLGAGTGAIASSVSGGKSEDLWIGALTGAGVNIIGGTLLDVLTDSGSNATSANNAYRDRRNYNTSGTTYAANKRPTYVRKWYYEDEEIVPKRKKRSAQYEAGYKEGYQEGYKDAYIEGYKAALKDYAEKL